MRPIHTLAAAVIALGGFGLAVPAGAAPGQGLSVTAEASAAIHQVGHRDGDRDWGRGGRDWRRGDRDDDWRRHRSRSWDDWSRNRHRDRDDWRRHSHRDGSWDRGRHSGWDRGHGHGWHDGDWKKRKHWAKKHKRWHARHHPRHRHWVGRHFLHHDYVVIREYDHYYLPPPPYGYFYARVDRDVFLVAEGTKRIIDAFVLFDAVGR